MGMGTVMGEVEGERERERERDTVMHAEAGRRGGREKEQTRKVYTTRTSMSTLPLFTCWEISFRVLVSS